MNSLTSLNLSGTAVEELPLSIGNLTKLDKLYLDKCKNLKRLPINIILRLQHLRDVGIFVSCTNLVKKMGSTTMEDEISSNEEQLQELAPPTNSSNGSSALQVLNHQNCFQSESNFFPISSFFTMFNSSDTLTDLDLSGSEFVSLPTSFKGFVALKMLNLEDCKKLEEILELPPNIRSVNVRGCKSLERFSEVSRIMEFNGSHIKSLDYISLEGCDKMHEKIWNYKVPNPLQWKGRYNAAVLPENEIPEWLWYQKEFLENEIAKRGDDDIQFKRDEEWVINIEGSHYVEDINGIVIYLVTFIKEDFSRFDFYPVVDIGRMDAKSVLLSNHDEAYCDRYRRKSIIDQYKVLMWYIDSESLEFKVLDNLCVELRARFHPDRFHPDPSWEQLCSRCYYVSFGVNVVYKHESKRKRKRKEKKNVYRHESRARDKRKMK
ncbi:hypothetical protein I3843_15G099500 [Carya illinoinensis]|nr:hypothetical protein I3843_Q014800 [Carya illinoinensis]KAG7944398.1 hypothetical protein I3843_15G099500 [Carya illinoinensis]